MKRVLLLLFALIFICAGCESSSGGSSESPQPSNLTLNKSSLSLLVGNSFKLVASKPDINWSSENSGIASVDNEGNVTGITVGTTKIIVKTDDNLNTATCTVDVTSNTVAVTGVTLNMSSAQIVVDGTVDLDETITPSNATNPSVTWSSNSPSTASVDNNGVVTGKEIGSTTIKVTTVDGSKTATCGITVKPKPVPVTGITLNRTNINIYPGLGVKLNYEISPGNATNKNVTWSTSDSNIAEVTSTGIVTGKKTGEVEITITTEDGNIHAVCTVKSDEHPVCTAGHYNSTSKDIPCYWINTSLYNLPVESGYYGFGYNPIIDSGNLYISGAYENNIWGVHVRCYWKNNERYDLPKPSGADYKNRVSFLGVKNGNIYHGGGYDLNGKSYGAYWRNNVRYDLPMPEGYSLLTISPLFDLLDDGTVLAYHALYNSTTHTYKLCYWLDQVYYELPFPEGAIQPSLENHLIDGNDIYFTGDHGYSDNRINLYWKNQILINLAPVNTFSGGAKGVIAVNGNYYMYGCYRENNDAKPCYWRNNEPVILPIPVSSEGYTTSMAVVNNDVYVTGYYNTGISKVPCFWKNNTRYDLSPQSSDFKFNILNTLISGNSLYFAYEDKPSYWMDDTENQLPLPDDYPDFTQLYYMNIHNNKVYSMSRCKNSGNGELTCYWINSTRYDFEPGSRITTDSTKIFVSDGNVYSIGQFYNGVVSEKSYWINTTRYDLEKFHPGDIITANYITRP